MMRIIHDSADITTCVDEDIRKSCESSKNVWCLMFAILENGSIVDCDVVLNRMTTTYRWRITARSWYDRPSCKV